MVVSDLKGSTALAERLDPESLREVLRRYFDEMRVVLEAHGGRFEKVIGDAIVTVFGLDDPDADDGAMRAVEAAAETRGVLATLNDQLERRWGVRLANRTGVSTGDVIVADAAGDRVITGDAIDVATRMEQAAPSLEVLLAASTFAIVRDRVTAFPEPDVAMPSGAPVAAHRLDAVVARAGSAGRARRSSGGEATGARRETRRTVTIVFADARVASGVPTPTPEALSDAASRYFAVVREILERHGGTVERYIGDAVMAVFGLERRREDDALRAVRAAVEMRDALPPLNDVLALAGAPRLEQRIGVNTGHLVAGDGADRQRLVTGDAVNVAARLEQTAAVGEVVVGGQTAALVGGGATLEPREPLTLKGKSEPVQAFRVRDVAAAGPARGLEAPMVGRDSELARLQALLGEARRERATRFAVVTGDAGVGKSRLVAELTAAAAANGALVLRGQCLSYGEGITFWPVVEIVHQAAGITADDSADAARRRLWLLADGEPAVAQRLASLAGLSDLAYPLSELFWAVRRLLALLGASRTVLVQIDDAHWAEPTLAELVAHLAEADDAPVLVVLSARPELLERHGELLDGAGELVELEPLSAADANRVIANVLGDDGLPVAVRERIIGASAGNPLFVEQLLSMLVDTGRLTRERGRWRVQGDPSDLAIPPSIEALVAARVDELPGPERGVLEPASVVGGEFSADAVGVLADPPVAPDIAVLLEGLHGRQMVEPVPQPDGPFDHRFTHPMIRDVTYEGMLKRVRADLHERFVGWAEAAGTTADRSVEIEELLGYHLEQAHRYRAELGPLDDHGRALGRRAADRLGAAGHRALDRGDMPAAANLLRRAAGALPDDHGDAARLLVHAGQAEMETGRFAEADATLANAAARAAEAGMKGLASIARLERTRLAYNTGGGVTDDEVAAMGEGGVYAFTAAGDDEGLATAWRLLLNVRLTECQFGGAEHAAEAIVTHATRARNRLLATRMRSLLAGLALRGPLPTAAAVPRCERIVEELADDRQAEAVARRALAHLRAMRGEVDAAREECRRCRAELEEFGWLLDAALVSLDAGPIALLAGDPAEAEAELRRDLDTLDAMGERNYISTTSALLGEALYRQGRLAEAAEAVAFSREVAAEGDVATHIILHSVHGKLLARDGDAVAGVASCRQAVSLAEGTDDPLARGYAQADLAEALLIAGDRPGARDSYEAARVEHDAKGNLLALADVERALAELARG